jgi:TPR repeat protein
MSKIKNRNRSMKDAAAAYERGDNLVALPILRRLARQGDAEAQYWLGAIYDDRSSWNGDVSDACEAVKWYRRAANKGDAEARYYLGLMYFNGRGVTRDYGEAAKWFLKSAEQGDENAPYYLARCTQKAKVSREIFRDASKVLRHL